MPREIWIWHIFALSSNFGRILKFWNRFWWIIYWGVVETLVKHRGREDFGKHFARTPLTCDAMLGVSATWSSCSTAPRLRGKSAQPGRAQFWTQHVCLYIMCFCWRPPWTAWVGHDTWPSDAAGEREKDDPSLESKSNPCSEPHEQHSEQTLYLNLDMVAMTSKTYGLVSGGR